MKALLDPMMTPLDLKTQMREAKDFSRYSKQNIMTKSPKSKKVFI